MPKLDDDAMLYARMREHRVDRALREMASVRSGDTDLDRGIASAIAQPVTVFAMLVAVVA